MNKIFQIEVRTTVYFYGEEYPENQEIIEAVTEEMYLENYDESGTSLNSAEGLPKDVLNSYPYGEDGDRHTIGEWLEHG